MNSDIPCGCKVHWMSESGAFSSKRRPFLGIGVYYNCPYEAMEL